MVEAGNQSMTCYPIATTSEGPGPRVGHASLLVGNAFIVFGGDTKMDEGDMLDDTLYLLNTCESTRDAMERVDMLTICSNQAVVTSATSRSETAWTIWPHSEYIGQQDLHIWWASGRLLFQRFGSI